MITGGFSETGENGLNVFDFNTSSGKLSHVSSINAGSNPSYLCFSPKHKMIYAINEVSEFLSKKGGGLTTLKYDGNFENLKKVSEMTIPTNGPCFVSLSPGKDYLLIANYGGGSVAVVKLDETGLPVEVTDSIIYNGMDGKRSHPHMIDSDPGGERIYVTDLGLDRIMIYKLDEGTGKLIALSETGIKVEDGTGPRHFVFNASGNRLYLMGELKSTVTVFETGREDGLKQIQSISSLEGKKEVRNASADIHIGKNGDFLYATNRGENTVAVFRIRSDGTLIPAGHADCGGNWPRNFTIDPTGKFILVANQKSGNIAVFRLKKFSGMPGSIADSAKVSGVSCLKF
jgi:6-phosphogluconolactonase